MKTDMKTLNTFRALFHEGNKKWCPEGTTPLRMFVEEHFIDRLFQRFTTNVEAAAVVKNTMKWVKDNYAILQFENNFGTKREYCIRHADGNVSVVVLFNNVVRIRTCYKPTEQQND